MFSAGRVNVQPERGQAGFAGRPVPTFNAGGNLNDAVVVDRDQGQNQMNPYGIPGSQGPSINLARAARAIRGRLRGDAPIPVVTIDRRVDPQAPLTSSALVSSRSRAIHNAQEQIPGRPVYGIGVKLNYFDLPNRRGIQDPEALGREGEGRSRMAGGQTTGVGMQNTTRSSADIDESPAPTRIPHVWNDGLNAAAGLDQYAFTQQNYTLFLPHIYFAKTHPVPTRGIRAVSGVRQADGPTASRIRIPAVFVPSAVG